MIDRQYKYLTSSTVVFYISYSLVYTEEGKNYRVGFSDVHIVVQPGSLAARMYQSWQKYFTDLGIFQILRPNLEILVILDRFWPIIDIFGQKVLIHWLRMPERQELFAGLVSLFKSDLIQKEAFGKVLLFN